MGIRGDQNIYYIYRDHRSNLEYIRSGNDVCDSGLYILLGGYQYNALLDFREVYDYSGSYYQINNFLNGRGVPSVENAKNELHLSGVHLSLRKLLSPDVLYKFDSLLTEEKMDKTEIKEILSGIFRDVNYFINELNHIKNIPFNNQEILKRVEEDINASRLYLSALREIDSLDNKPDWFNKSVLSITVFGENGKSLNRSLLLPIIVLRNLSHQEINDLPGSGNLIDKLMMDRIFFEVFAGKGTDHDDIGNKIFLSRAIINYDIPDNNNAVKFLDNAASHYESANFIGLHEFKGVRYFNKENFELYLDWQLTFSGIEALKELNMRNSKSKKTKSDTKKITNKLRSLYDYYSSLKVASYEAGYEFDKTKKLLNEEPKSIETGINKKAVKKQTAMSKIKSKISDIKKKSDTKKKTKITKKADKKKISETKKKAKIKKKVEAKKISDIIKKSNKIKKSDMKKKKK
jgi:hypothetical protein